MKLSNIAATCVMLVGVLSYGQKDELKAIEKLVKKESFKEALSSLNNLEVGIANAEAEDKAKFYFLKGDAALGLVKNKVNSDTNTKIASAALLKVIEIEAPSGKSKYTSDAKEDLRLIKNNLLIGAGEDSKIGEFKKGSQKLYDAYLVDKTDTINLYYAANFDLSAKDYDAALDKFKDLHEMKYNGRETLYYAVNIKTMQEDQFPSKEDSKFAVKESKTHISDRVEKVPSKRPEIYKNLVLLSTYKKDYKTAKKFIERAIKYNPNDIDLLKQEAAIYVETKDFDTYKTKVNELLAKNPNDVNLVFNMGVVSAQTGDKAAAEQYYKKAIEIDENYINAYINLVALKLESEKPINDEISKLGVTAADNKRYDVLKAQKNTLYKEVIPYLVKANTIDPKDANVYSVLSGVYGALDMKNEKAALDTSFN